MNILLVNGSPKPTGSTSATILETLRRKIGESHSFSEVSVRREPKAVEIALGQGALVIAFPLYVDSLPAHFLEWLISLQSLRAETPGVSIAKGSPGPAIFAIANCGFYEGEQCGSALRIIANFARRSGYYWGGGLGIGTGGMIRNVAKAPEGAWIKREVTSGLSWIAGEITALAMRSVRVEPSLDRPFEQTVRYVTHAFPRFAYIFMANAGWRQMAHANGLRTRDLRARPVGQE